MVNNKEDQHWQEDLRMEAGPILVAADSNGEEDQIHKRTQA